MARADTRSQSLNIQPTARARLDKTLILALMDQGLVSGGTFLTNVAIARLTLPETYGAYALYLSAMQLANNVHAAIVVYPVSLFISSFKEPKTDKSPILAALIFTFVMSTFLGSVGLFLLYLLDHKHLSIMSLPALVAWQVQELLRRTLMAELKFIPTAIADFISYPLQALLVFAVASRYQASLHVIFFCVFVTSLIAILIQGTMLFAPLRQPQIGFTDALHRFWLTGRWNLVSVILDMSSIQGLPTALGLRFGPVSVAQLLSLVNVVGITHPIMFGISNVAVPRIARAKARIGSDEVRKESLKLTSWGGGLIGIYLLVIMWFPYHSLSFFYGTASPYTKLVAPMRIIGLSYVAIYISTAATMVLKGVDLSKLALKGSYIFAISSVVISIPCAVLYGVQGAAVGLLLASTIKAVIQVREVLPRLTKSSNARWV